MIILQKIFSVIGILASLSAAEGLNRFGGFIGSMGGKDAPFYMVLLAVSVIAVIFFILAIIGRLSRLMKWLAVICLAASVVIMFFAPSLPVIMQIIVSLIIAFLCMLFAPIAGQ